MPTSNFQPVKLLHPGCWYKFTYLMTNSADPDQLASSEAIWSGHTVCKGRIYPGSAGQGLDIFSERDHMICFSSSNLYVHQFVANVAFFFKFYDKYGKALRCPNTLGKYCKLVKLEFYTNKNGTLCVEKIISTTMITVMIVNIIKNEHNYENTPNQIYWEFFYQKWKLSDENFW